MSFISVTIRGTDRTKLIPVADILDVDGDVEGGAIINYRDGRAPLPITSTAPQVEALILAAASGTVAASYLQITDGVTAPGALTGVARIYVDTADGDLKAVFADGTVKTIVTDT